MKSALAFIVAILSLSSATQASLITLNPLSASGIKSDSQTVMTIDSGIISQQYSIDPSTGSLAARLITSATIDLVEITYQQKEYYTYSVDVKMTGRDIRSMRSASTQTLPFSETHGTPATFAGAIDLDHINDSMGQLDVGMVQFTLSSGLVDNAIGSLSKSSNGTLTAVYHFDLRGPASHVEIKTFVLTQAPEPGSVALTGLAGIGLLARRRRR
ncbi:MAG: PEP-CTERM sorting domain-containing protein [Patescibacteria group bacterium]